MKGKSLLALQTSIRYFYIKCCSVLENIIEFPEVDIYKFGNALLLTFLNFFFIAQCSMVGDLPFGAC